MRTYNIKNDFLRRHENIFIPPEHRRGSKTFATDGGWRSDGKVQSDWAQDPEDLVSIGTIGLLKAVDTYDGTKGYKLVTYAARCIDNELLMYFRGRKKQAKDVSLFEPIGSDKEGNQISLYDVLEQEPMDIAAMMDQQNDLLRLRDILPQVLNAREQEIICKRYGIGRLSAATQKEIAGQLGISRSYVSRIEKRALEKLRGALLKNS